VVRGAELRFRLTPHDAPVLLAEAVVDQPAPGEPAAHALHEGLPHLWVGQHDWPQIAQLQLPGSNRPHCPADESAGTGRGSKRRSGAGCSEREATAPEPKVLYIQDAGQHH
jgi:hypothetical protein